MASSESFCVYGADGRYLEPSSFIDAVAPTEEGFNRISRQQYSICKSCARA
jgi:solute carrier family 25 aspartate/glutamate transporter 12/13